MPMDREVPMLLRDPVTMLLHLLMQLPMHVDLAYFTSMVQGIYNLVYIQVLSGLSCAFQSAERECWKQKMANYSSSENPNLLSFLLGAVIRYLEKFPFYWSDTETGEDMDQDDASLKTANFTSEEKEEQLELRLQSLLLPYLRVSSLLRHHIYEQDLPVISSPKGEFLALAEFLGLGVTTGSASMEYNDIYGVTGGENMRSKEPLPSIIMRAHSFLSWISPTPLTTIWTWCEDFGNFIGRARVASVSLLQTHHKLWSQPKLMELPQAYDIIFQYYHRKHCPNCSSVPKDPNICLICGAIVCMRDQCCKIPNNSCEAIEHAVNCGAGTAIYLSVNSSTIVVVRGRRACLWGSVYLDSFGEEDRELK